MYRDRYRERMTAAIRTYILETIPEWSDPENQRLINAAHFDLWHGPHGAGWEPDGDGWQYPGWDAAADAIGELVSLLPSTLYYDADCAYVTDSEPEGYWTEPEEDADPDGADEPFTPEWVEPAPYYVLDRADITRAMLGPDLAANL